MTRQKYEATGVQSEFQPGSRNRVLRNLLGITRVRDMNEAESQALELAQQAVIHCRYPCGDESELCAADPDIRADYREVETRCFQ